MKILVHPGTGTIIALDECVVVDTESLNEEDAAIFGDGDDEDSCLEVFGIKKLVRRSIRPGREGKGRSRLNGSLTGDHCVAQLHHRAIQHIRGSIHHPQRKIDPHYLRIELDEAMVSDGCTKQFSQRCIVRKASWRDFDLVLRRVEPDQHIR